MTPKQAKAVAAEFSEWLELWYDRHIRLWCITDRRMNAASDYISPGWLADFTEPKLREYLSICAAEIAEVNDIPAPGDAAITQQDVDALADDLSLHLDLDDARIMYLATMLIRIARGTLSPDSGISGLVEELREYCTPRREVDDACPVCGKLIAPGTGEYKLMPDRGHKHPPCYALHHPDCEHHTCVGSIAEVRS